MAMNPISSKGSTVISAKAKPNSLFGDSICVDEVGICVIESITNDSGTLQIRFFKSIRKVAGH